jgi:hypothetical protein
MSRLGQIFLVSVLVFGNTKLDSTYVYSVLNGRTEGLKTYAKVRITWYSKISSFVGSSNVKLK